MHKDVWLLLSPLIVIMGIGVLMFLLGAYWMIFDSVRAGIQPLTCGMVAIAIPGTVVAMIYNMEKK